MRQGVGKIIIRGSFVSGRARTEEREKEARADQGGCEEVGTGSEQSQGTHYQRNNGHKRLFTKKISIKRTDVKWSKVVMSSVTVTSSTHFSSVKKLPIGKPAWNK